MEDLNAPHFDPELLDAAEKAHVVLCGPEDRPPEHTDPGVRPPLVVIVDDFLVSTVVKMVETSPLALLQANLYRAEFFKLSVLDPLLQAGPMADVVHIGNEVLWFFHYLRHTPTFSVAAQEVAFRGKERNDALDGKYRAWKQRQIASPRGVIVPHLSSEEPPTGFRHLRKPE